MVRLKGCGGIPKPSTRNNQMEVPLYVLDPHEFSEEKFSEGKERYIRITEIEPGSELAQAVVRIEREHEASYDRLRKIAAYFGVKLK
jgi:hypothetical protein